MPKKNQFSGLSEPDKDTCTESSPENIKRFREATLKLDRIHNADNERDIADNIIQLCITCNKANLKIAWDLDYEDAMEILEKVYNDVDANRMITAIEGTTISGMNELQSELDSYSAGDTVTITLARQQGQGFQEMDVDVTLISASEVE